jgi:hypothetical protein
MVRPAALLSVIAALGAYLALLREHRFALVDDAFIPFRYAVRWAEGHGLTWNDGVAVEGFSSPLWTVGWGAAARLGVPPERVVLWAAGAAVAGALLILARMAGRAAWTRPATAAALGVLALDVGFVQWAGSGLETPASALAVVAWLALARKRSISAPRGLVLGVGAAVLSLLRPEGILWALAGGAWLLWGVWAPGRVLAAWAAGWLVPFGAYLAFRIHRYGEFLPNTFYAKVEPSGRALVHGLEDVGAWAAAHAVVLAAALAAVGIASRRGGAPPGGASAAETEAGAETPPPPCWISLLVGWLALQALFVLAVGGDWMGRLRYPAPMAGAGAVLVGEAVHRIRPSPRMVLVALAAHLALGFGLRDALPGYTGEAERLGRWLREVAAPGDRLAVSAAGAIPYFSRLPTYDVLGLNDPEVRGRRARRTAAWNPAHNRYDLDRLMAVRPEWIVWDSSVPLNRARLREYHTWDGDPDTLDFRRSLLAREDFRKSYRIEGGAPPETRTAFTVFRLR